MDSGLRELAYIITSKEVSKQSRNLLPTYLTWCENL